MADRITRILALYCGLMSVALVVWMFWLFSGSRFDPDFSVFWTAARIAPDPAVLYDPAAMTQAQAALVDPAHGLRPWVYPPTALLMFEPFAFLPFWAAYGVWCALSLALFVAVMARVLSGWGLALSLVSYPVWFTLASGQTTLIISALAVAGLVTLTERPTLAGLLLALAMCLKPQLMILAPVAVVAGAHWHVLAAALGAGITVAGASVIAYGWAMWPAWITAVQGLDSIVQDLGIEQRAVSIGGMLRGVEAPWATGLHGIAALAALVICIWVFRAPSALPARLIAMIGGAFLISPYAMPYDVAALIPAAALVLMSPKTSPRHWLATALAIAVFFPVPPAGAVAVVSFALLGAVLLRHQPSAAHD